MDPHKPQNASGTCLPNHKASMTKNVEPMAIRLRTLPCGRNSGGALCKLSRKLLIFSLALIIAPFHVLFLTKTLQLLQHREQDYPYADANNACMKVLRLEQVPSQIELEAGLKQNITTVFLTSLALLPFDAAVLQTAKKFNISPTQVEQIVEQTPAVRAPEAPAEEPPTQAVATPAKPTNEPVAPKPAGGWHVTDDMVKAVISVEGASPTHVGRSGDTGTMQILPSTWEEINRSYFGGKYPYKKYAKNHQVNVMFGKQYLLHIKRWLDGHKDKLKGDPVFLMFAAYNGGMGSVEKAKFDPTIIAQYLPRVFDYASRAYNLASG